MVFDNRLLFNLVIVNADNVITVQLNNAVDENSSLSYRASPAVWDHTVLPAS